jgi:hypothetical protein
MQAADQQRLEKVPHPRACTGAWVSVKSGAISLEKRGLYPFMPRVPHFSRKSSRCRG